MKHLITFALLAAFSFACYSEALNDVEIIDIFGTPDASAAGCEIVDIDWVRGTPSAVEFRCSSTNLPKTPFVSCGGLTVVLIESNGVFTVFDRARLIEIESREVPSPQIQPLIKPVWRFDCLN